MQVYTRKVILRDEGSQDLSASAGTALSMETAFGKPWRLTEVLVHTSVDITETITITKTSKTSASYDTELASNGLSVANDYVFRPTGECLLQEDDEIKVQCTAANATGTVYVTIVGEEC